MFERDSRVRERMLAYGSHFDAIDVFIFSLQSNAYGVEHLEHGVTLYPLHWRSSVLWSSQIREAWKVLSHSDVITVQDPGEMGMLGLCAARLLGKKLHVQVHTDIMNPAFYEHNLRNKIIRAFSAVVLPRASRIRVVAKRIEDSIRSRVPESTPISVLPIYVDRERFQLREKKQHPRFGLTALCIGRLEPEKNFSVAIEALREAREKGHDVGLVIVGSGSQREALKKLAVRREVFEYVEFVAHSEDLRPYYAYADIMLVPSAYEGYGMAIVEALASGVPVLATDVGVAREAGAIITSVRLFPSAFVEWVELGSRRGELRGYPYASFEDYVKKVCEDMQAT